MKSVTPTLVIGVGEAGWKMVKHVRNLVNEQLGDDAASDGFQYIIMDTSYSDMENEFENEENLYTFRIQKPDYASFGADCKSDEYQYLSERMRNPGSVTGSNRRRVIGRYHFDNNEMASEFRGLVDERIDKLMDDARGSDDVTDSEDQFNVWLLNSLGGGTGSGLFPRVAAEIDTVNHNRNESMYLCGIGGLPELSATPGRVADASGYEYRINAYTALREIENLVGYDQTRYEKQTMEVPGGIDKRLHNEPFEEYYLLGHDEEPTSSVDQFYTSINRSAGILIIMYSLMEAIENFPNFAGDGIRDSNSLFAVDAHEIHVPLKESAGFINNENSVEEVADIAESISGQDGQLNQIRNDLKTIRSVRNIVEGYMEADFIDNSTNLIGADPRVEKEEIETIKNRASVNPEDEIVDTSEESDGWSNEYLEFDIDEKIRNLKESVILNLPSDEVPEYDNAKVKDAIVRLVYNTYLEDDLDDELDGHNFRTMVENYMADYLYPGEYTDSDLYGKDTVETAYQDEVKDDLENVIADLEKEANDSGFTIPVFGDDPQEELKKEKMYKQEFEVKLAAYERIKDVKDRARKNKRNAEAELRQVGANVDDAHDDRETRKRDIESEIESETTEAQRIHNRYVTRPRKKHKYHQIPLDIDVDDHELTDEYKRIIRENNSITDLVKSDYVDFNTYVQKLKEVIQQMDSVPLHPRRNTDTKAMPAMITHEENLDKADQYNPIETSETLTGENTISKELGRSYFDMNIDRLRIGSQGRSSFWVIGLYSPLKYEQMDEFEYVRAYFEGDEYGGMNKADLTPDELDEEDGNIYTSLRFAYPELLNDELEAEVRNLSGRPGTTAADSDD